MVMQVEDGFLSPPLLLLLYGLCFLASLHLVWEFHFKRKKHGLYIGHMFRAKESMNSPMVELLGLFSTYRRNSFYDIATVVFCFGYKFKKAFFHLRLLFLFLLREDFYFHETI